jgi:tRNA nucleotidyltransferase (CCA-adding enzyme)
VPEIKIGTPEQDAYRRDLTINSMFYNINKGIIEDFTG